MIKKILFALVLSFSFQWVAAQTVSDDQIVKIIIAEKERGADETTIARKLLQQGATPAQIRRIKEKYEQEQNGLYTYDREKKFDEEIYDRIRAINTKVAAIEK